MCAKVKFISIDRVSVETAHGDRFMLGLSSPIPFELQAEEAQVIAVLFDKYYQGDPNVIMGPILRGLMQQGRWAHIYWYGPDRDNERERIGALIKSRRQERRMEAKDLAQLADIAPSNLSRIEKGKLSAGLDILCRIAAAMDCYVDIVPNGRKVSMAGRIIEEGENKVWLITVKRSVFRLAECLAQHGSFYWQQGRYNIRMDDTVYIYISESRRIEYKMSVMNADHPYNVWVARDDAFYVDKERIKQSEVDTKYALLELEAVSHSGLLIEENLIRHGFRRAPQGTKELTGELLKFIEDNF